MVDMNVFRIAGIIDILLYLERYPEGRRKVDIRTDLNLNSTTAIKAHKELQKGGFIHGLTYSNATAWSLTPLGMEVAKSLKKIKKSLKKFENDTEKDFKGTWFLLMDKQFPVEKGRPPKDDD